MPRQARIVPTLVEDPLHVAVGVIYHEELGFLLSRRRAEQSHAHRWEFPGGKIEKGETPFVALCRELTEELGIVIEQGRFIRDLQHRYPDNTVQLSVWQILSFRGRPTSREKQDFRYFSWAELQCLEMLDANKKLLPDLRLLADR